MEHKMTLYETPLSDFDTNGDSISQMVDSTYEIYPREQEEKWGTLAIRIEVID